MEVIASHLDEGRQEENNLLNNLQSVIYDSKSTGLSLGNNISEFHKRHRYSINQYPGSAKVEILKTLETIKTHSVRGCLDGLHFQHANFDHIIENRFHKLHALLQKLTCNVHLGLTMLNALVSIGFHKFNISKGIQQQVPLPPIPNNLIPITTNNKDSTKDIALTSSLDTLIGQFSSKIDKGKVKEQKKTFDLIEDAEPSSSIIKDDQIDLFCGFLMFLKCFKNVSHCAPDLIKSSHLLPHFVSSTQVISIPCFSEEASEIHTDYTNDVERIQDLVANAHAAIQNSSALPGDITNSFLTYFIRHLTTLNELGEYRGHLTSIGTKFGINFDAFEETLDKVHNLLQSSKDSDSRPNALYVEHLSNLFSVVFLFVTNIKRFPLVPVYPDKWNVVSLFVLVLIEEGHPMVMLDPVSLCNNQDDRDAGSSATSSPSTIVRMEMKKFNCRCGRGQAEKNLPPKCVNRVNSDDGVSKKYSCRCLCFRAGESCSDLCDCRACGNPYGVHLTKTRSRLIDQSKPLRQRNLHSAQKSLKHIMGQFNSVRRKYNKQLQKTQWSFAEHALFEYCLAQLVSEISLRKGEKDNLLIWSNHTVLIDMLHEKYQIFCGHIYSAFPDLEQNLITKKSKCDLEKRYIERQESIYTYF